MAEFFKSAARAGAEVRRLGQVGPEAKKDPSLRVLSEAAQGGMDALPPMQIPRRGISAPQPQPGSIEEYLQAYRNEAPPIEEAPAPDQSEGTLAGDVGRSVGRGALGLGGGIYELGNLATGGALDRGTKAVFGTSGTEAISSARESLNQADSAELQAQRAELEQADGFWDSMGTVLTNPRLLGSMALEMVPQVVTVVGAAKMVASRTLASQIAKGATKEAAERSAQRAATLTVMGVNPALEGGMAASDTRATVLQMPQAELEKSPQYQALVAQGYNPEDARGRLANDAATFAAAVAAPISLASTALFGSVEGTLARRGISSAATNRTLGQIGREVAVGGVKEMAQESVEEGGSQFGQNVGMSRVNPDQDLFEGVPQAAGAGAALGLVMGAGANVRLPSSQEPATPPSGIQSPDQGQTPPAAPTAQAMDDREFQSVLQSDNAVPYLSAIYAQSDENTRSQLSELARRNNIQVDLEQSSQVPEVVNAGIRMVEASPSFAQAFVERTSQELLRPDRTPLAPKPEPMSDAEIQADIDRNMMSREDETEAMAFGIEEDAKQMGIEPSVTPQETLMRGYQRRAQNISGMPSGARRAAATSSIAEMVGRGFSAEQAESVFGPFLQDDAPQTQTPTQAPQAEPVVATQPEAVQADAAPVEATAQTVEPQEPIDTATDLSAPEDKEIISYQEPPTEEGVMYTPEVVVENSEYLASATGAEQIIDFKKPLTSGEFAIGGMRLTRDFVSFRGETQKSKQVSLYVDDNYLELQSGAGGFARISRTELKQENLFRRVIGDDAVNVFLSSKPEETQRRFSATLLGKDYQPVIERLSKLFSGKYSAQTPQTADTQAPVESAPQQPVTPFNQIRDGLAKRDQDRYGAPSSASDYIEVPVDKDIAAIAEAFGVPVYAYRYTGNSQKIRNLSGSRTQMGIVLNSRVENQHLSILGHEMYHELARRNPEAAAQLDALVQDYLSSDGKKKYRDWMRKSAYDPDRYNEEITADIMGVMFTDREFWSLVNQKNPTLMQKIFQVISDLVERMSALGSRGTKMKGFITEYETVRQMMADFVNQQTNKDADLDFTKEENKEDLDFTPEAQDRQEQKRQEGLELMQNPIAPPEESKAIEKMDKTIEKIGKVIQEISEVLSASQQSARQEDIPNRPATPGVEQDDPVSRSRNPAVKSGSFREDRAPAQDVLEQEEMRKETKRRRRERLAEKRTLIKPKPRKAPTRQGELGETPEVRRFQARAQQIMNNLVSPSAVQDQIKKLSAALERMQEDRQAPRSQVEYIFNQFAQAGALSDDDMSDLGNAERQREKITALREKINDLQKSDLKNRAEAIKLNIQAVDDALADLRIEMERAGVAENIIDDVLLERERGVEAVKSGQIESLEQVEDILENNEQPEENLDLFGEENVNAAQLVDAIQNEADTLRALVTLKTEAEAAGVGNLDIYNELRLRGITVSPELVSFASRPGVRYTLDFWIKQNQGRNPYIVREEWFGSLDQTINQLRGTEGETLTNELSPEERKLYNDWKAERKALRDRLKKGEEVDDAGNYKFATLDNAFPHALFNKYPLSAMFDPTKLPEADRPALLALVGGNPEQLPTLWFEDVRHVISSRSDLEAEVRDTLSEQDFDRYQEYRNRKIREFMRDKRMLAQSPAFSQLMQLKGYLSDELYQQYYSQIAQANANQYEAILQAAYEIAEAQRAATESNRDVDAATDAVIEAVYGHDETLSVSPNQMPTMDSDEVADPFPDEVEGQPATEEDVSDIIDRLRTRRGRFSGVVVAAEVSAHLNKITSLWRNAPRVTVLNNVMQLPEEIRNAAIQKLGNSGAKGLIADDGSVYIFSDFIENLEDAEFTLFHEVYGHFGMRQFLGDKLDQFLESQYRVNQKVRAAADKLMKESKEAGRGITQLEATEEAIADMAMDFSEPTLILKIKGALVRFLRSIKMQAVAEYIESRSGGELGYVLSHARKGVREGRFGPMDGAPFGLRFSASKLPVEIFGTKGDNTTAYARYNPVTHQWTVFWDKDGLKAQKYGITTVENYEEAIAIVRQYGRAMSSRDFPGRSQKDPSVFTMKIPSFNDAQGWKRVARRAQIKLQNKLLPVYEVARWINANGGNTNLEQVLKLHRGKIKPHVDEFNRKYLRPISKLLSGIEAKGGSLDELDLYLAARHAEERNDRVKEINPQNKMGSGISNGDAKRILSDFEKTQYANELRAVGMLMDGLSRAKVDYMLAHGLIGEEQARALATYEHYVNLSGNRSDSTEKVDKAVLGGRSVNLRGNDARRATGRFTAAVDVLENTLNSYLGTIIRGQKNMVAQSVLRMVDDNPDPNFAVVNRIAMQRKMDINKLIQDKLLLKYLGDQPNAQAGQKFLNELAGKIALGNVSEEQAAGIIRDKLERAYERGDITGNQLAGFFKRIESADLNQGKLSKDGYVSEVEDTAYMNRENVFVVKDQGRPVTIEFLQRSDDPLGSFANALHGAHQYVESDTLGAFGAFNRFIGQLITSRNLTWVPVNWIRDIGTAYFNAAADPTVGPKLAKQMAREAPRAYALAFKDLIVEDYADKNSMVYRWLKRFAKKPISAEDKQLFEEFKKDGGETYFLDRKDIKEQIEALQRELNPNTGLRGTWDAYGKFADLLGQPAELSARFAAYKVLRKAGRTREEAAVYAKEITVNFEQSGSSAWIRSLLLFFNPSIQGTARMFKDYSSRSGAGKLIPNKQFGQIIVGLMGLGVLTGFVARAMGADGEDDEINDLDQIPSGKRATSIVLVPGVPLGAPIPLPYGWNVFYAMGHFAADSIFGDTPVSQTASRIASSAVSSFWPAGARDTGNFVKDTALSFVPTAISPAVDIWMNENRFGAPIAKENNPFTRTEEANAYMNFNSASPVSVYLMRQLNELTGGTQYSSGAIDINPAYVDYVLSQYLPGLPTDIGRTANLAVNAAIGRDVKNPPLPLVDRFGSKISEGWNAGAFRRAQTYIDTKYKDAATSQGGRKDEILKEHPKLGEAKDSLGIIDQQIRNMRTNLRVIEQNPDIPFSEKVAARNKVEEMEKAYYKQGVALAVKAGFKEQVIADN